MRRDPPPAVPEVAALRGALEGGDLVFTTRLVLQELLQGFRDPKAKQRIVEDLAALLLVVPDRSDHVEAPSLRSTCRRGGIQIGTIDALLARLCLHHDLMLLTTDADFRHMASVCPLVRWRG